MDRVYNSSFVRVIRKLSNHAENNKQPKPFYEDTNYSGTEYYYKLFGGILITDGVKDILEKFHAFWTTDILYELPKEGFFVIRVYVYDDNTADVVVEDGNHNIVKRKHYKYTDLDVSLKFYYADGVLLLPLEY